MKFTQEKFVGMKNKKGMGKLTWRSDFHEYHFNFIKALQEQVCISVPVMTFHNGNKSCIGSSYGLP